MNRLKAEGLNRDSGLDLLSRLTEETWICTCRLLLLCCHLQYEGAPPLLCFLRHLKVTETSNERTERERQRESSPMAAEPSDVSVCGMAVMTSCRWSCSDTTVHRKMTSSEVCVCPQTTGKHRAVSHSHTKLHSQTV